MNAKQAEAVANLINSLDIPLTRAAVMETKNDPFLVFIITDSINYNSPPLAMRKVRSVPSPSYFRTLAETLGDSGRKFQVGDIVKLVRNKNNYSWVWCKDKEDIYGTILGNPGARDRRSLHDEPLSDNWYRVKFWGYNYLNRDDLYHTVEENDLELVGVGEASHVL